MQDFPLMFCEVICVNQTNEKRSDYPRIDALRTAFDERGQFPVSSKTLCDLAVSFNFEKPSYNHRPGDSSGDFLIPGGILVFAGQQSATLSGIQLLNTSSEA